MVIFTAYYVAHGMSVVICALAVFLFIGLIRRKPCPVLFSAAPLSFEPVWAVGLLSCCKYHPVHYLSFPATAGILHSSLLPTDRPLSFCLSRLLQGFHCV